MTIEHGEVSVPPRERAWRFRGLTVCVIGLVSGLVLLHRTGPGAASIPAELVYDFGTAKAGQPIDHVFRLRNPLALQLTVDRVASSCGCTAGQPPKLIPPRANVEIPVKVNLPDDDQKFESSVLITFKENPPVKLIVRGQVVRRYPSMIDFGIVRRGESVRREFRFRSDGTRASRISDLKFDPQMFKVTVEKDPANPQDQLCTVELIDSAKTAEIGGNIVARLDDANGELATIGCRGKVLQAVEIARPTIAAGTVAPGQPGSADIDIAAPYGDVLTISRVVSSDPVVMKCDAGSARRSEHGLILPVTVEAGFTGEVFRGTLDLTINAGSVPYKRSINVYGMKATPAKDTRTQPIPSSKEASG